MLIRHVQKRKRAAETAEDSVNAYIDAPKRKKAKAVPTRTTTDDDEWSKVSTTMWIVVKHEYVKLGHAIVFETIADFEWMTAARRTGGSAQWEQTRQEETKNIEKPANIEQGCKEKKMETYVVLVEQRKQNTDQTHAQKKK